jgi:hypothetical protein
VYVANNPLNFVDPFGLELSPNLNGELSGGVLNYLTSKGVKGTMGHPLAASGQ